MQPEQNPAPPTLADIESIPLTVEAVEEFLDYALTNDAEGVPISTRIPGQWIVAINLIREKPGTNLPQIWPTRASFLRWCVMLGIKQVAAYAASQDNPNESADPLLSAMNFVEKTAGTVAARAKTLTEAVETFEAIAQSVTINVSLGEYDEAARWLVQWFNGSVAQQSEYWRRVFYKIAASNLTIRPSLLSLLDNAHLEDAYLSAILEQQLQAEQDVATVPLSTNPNQ